MKKRIVLLIVFIGCCMLIGCTLNDMADVKDNQTSLEEVSQEEKDNYVTDFLLEFFNFNCNERYDTLMKSMENDDSIVDINDMEEGIQPLADNQQNAIDDYYFDLSKYVTKGCLDTMQANRLPVQLDSFVKEKGIVASVDYVELLLDDEDTYSYKVYFEEEGEVYFVDPLAGQVSIEIVDGEIKVSSISIVQ